MPEDYQRRKRAGTQTERQRDTFPQQTNTGSMARTTAPHQNVDMRTRGRTVDPAQRRTADNSGTPQRATPQSQDKRDRYINDYADLEYRPRDAKRSTPQPQRAEPAYDRAQNRAHKPVAGGQGSNKPLNKPERAKTDVRARTAAPHIKKNKPRKKIAARINNWRAIFIPQENPAPGQMRAFRDKRLAAVLRASAKLRVLVACLTLALIVLSPATLHDDGVQPVSGNDKVVLPIVLSTPTPEPTLEPEPSPEPTPTTITISAAGDCTLGYDPRLGYTNSLPDELERQGGDYSYFFRSVLPVFSTDDITIVNLEGTFTTSDNRVEGKTFCFKGDPLYRNILPEGSIEIVGLGNNHTKDYGTDGFNDTIENLRLAGIDFAVNGISCVRAVNGVNVGFLSYRNNTPELETLKSDINSLKAQDCALIICAFHWGEEYHNVANSTQLKLGRAAVDYGADLVLGTHPHVIGSIELYNGKYICYSLGNFCFGGNRNPDDKDTFIFRQTFTITDSGEAEDAGITIIPCRLSSTTKRNDYQPTIYDESNARRVLGRLNEFSSPLKYGVQLDESVLQWDWPAIDQ